MRPRGRRRGLAPAWLGGAVVALLLVPTPGLPGPEAVQAQDVLPPNRGGRTVSMGIPPTWRWAAGFSAGVHGADDAKVTAYANLGVYHDLLNPMTAALGVLGEAYAGTRGTFSASGGVDGGVRLGLFSPATRLAVGADYNFRDHDVDLSLSMIHPFQRGGILVRGGQLRIDYLPTRGHSLNIGVRLPFGQPFLGRSRPRQDHVELADPEPPPIYLVPDTTLVEALAQADTAAHWLNRLTMPYTEQWDWSADDALEEFATEMGELRDHMATEEGDGGGVRSPIEDVEAYHRALDRAFSIATSGTGLPIGETTPLGVTVSAKAREIILDQVLLPYNRLLGQKKDPDSTWGLGASASGQFYEWLSEEDELEFEELRATTWTFAQVLALIEDIRARNLDRWQDSRFVWLPFQLALKPDQHDEREELDALVERATRQPHTRGNKRWYIENDLFLAQLQRMILDAEDYHVLWIHDFRGYDSEGDPDEEGFRQVVEAYLPALINRVSQYDDVGKIPQYLIFIDQMYFLANQGRLWLDLLQDPLNHEIDLPDGFESWEDSIAALQTDLRRAVAGSRLMQSQARHFGEDWIGNLVKVHVNVTNPPDPSFWTNEIFPFFMGTPDVIMRDHRKITFYDVTEEDPYKGRAIYTGMGVGEHYVGASWEDRSMMVQGPALLSLKDAARQLLLNQGLEAREIPWELQPRERAADYDQAVQDSIAAIGDWGWDVQLHNQIGFRFKAVSVFKATLYSLMPPGSVIKAPDSIWGSHFWASMLLGHALRGGRSLIIAPAIANAPSAGFPQMSRAQEGLTRVVVASEIFAPQLRQLGGLIKVGLYNSELPVGDVGHKLEAFSRALEETPWLKEFYGFHPDVVAGLATMAEELMDPAFEEDHGNAALYPPKLHMKANYFATREAWDQLLSLPEVGESFRLYFEELRLRNEALRRGEYRDPNIMNEVLLPRTREILVSYVQELPTEVRDRIAIFFAIGSHNQNNRSMVLDGEVALVVGGFSALFGLPDFLVIVGLSEWIDDLDELEELFPAYTGIKRRISHWIRIAV